MSGGSFDHNLAGIEDGQGVEWDATNVELIPTHRVGPVSGSVPPDCGNLLVGNGSVWTVLLADGVPDDWVLTKRASEPTCLEWTPPVTGIAIEDDGVEVATGVNRINFRDNLTVTDLGSGEVLVDVSASGGGGGGTTWRDPVPSGNGPGGTDDDEFADGAINAAWSQQTVSGSATWTEDGDVLSCLFSGQTASDAAAILKSISGTPSAPMTIETAIRLFGNETNFTMAGLVFTDGTGTGATSVVGHAQYGASANLTEFYIREGTLTNLSGTSFLNYDKHFQQGMALGWIFLRLSWTATNTFLLEMSPDGVSWTSFGVAAHSATLTPTHFGLWVSSWGGSSERIATFEYFRVS